MSNAIPAAADARSFQFQVFSFQLAGLRTRPEVVAVPFFIPTQVGPIAPRRPRWPFWECSVSSFQFSVARRCRGQLFRPREQLSHGQA